MRQPTLPTRDPHAHAANVERMLRDVREHLDEDLEKIDDDAAARILFDTAREVLDGLITSFEDYQQASGEWRDGIDTTIRGKEQMSVKDMMTHEVTVIGPDETIATAAQKMAQEDIGFLPVCDGERIVGAITDRDITVRGVAQGCDVERARVRDVMTSDITYCFEDDDVEKTARLMREHQVRRIVVVNRDKKLVGVVALGDLARQQQGQSADVLEAVSEAPPNN
jgi:CBS domain-containing protein